jgi:REP element-mobilizing transposase RayT
VRADFGAELVEMDGVDDHVDQLVACPPQVAIARLVNSLEGVSPLAGCASTTGSGPTVRTCGRRRAWPRRPVAPALETLNQYLRQQRPLPGRAHAP